MRSYWLLILLLILLGSNRCRSFSPLLHDYSILVTSQYPHASPHLVPSDRSPPLAHKSRQMLEPCVYDTTTAPLVLMNRSWKSKLQEPMHVCNTYSGVWVIRFFGSTLHRSTAPVPGDHQVSTSQRHSGN
jgi:hypothetical protein